MGTVHTVQKTYFHTAFLMQERRREEKGKEKEGSTVKEKGKHKKEGNWEGGMGKGELYMIKLSNTHDLDCIGNMLYYF